MTPQITRHAWKRFVTRWDGPFPRCPMATMKKLLEQAKEEDIGAGNVFRLLQNDMEPVRYLATGEWRFVLTEDGSRIITIERIIHRKKRPWKKRRR